MIDCSLCKHARTLVSIACIIIASRFTSPFSHSCKYSVFYFFSPILMYSIEPKLNVHVNILLLVSSGFLVKILLSLIAFPSFFFLSLADLSNMSFAGEHLFYLNSLSCHEHLLLLVIQYGALLFF